METADVFKWVAIFIVLYMLYSYFFKVGDRSSLSDLHSAKSDIRVDASKAPTGSTADFTYSIWFFVDDWNYRYGQPKVIFTRGTANSHPSPAVVLDNFVNDLHIKMSYKGTTSANTMEEQTTSITVNDIPLQRWTNLILSLNGRALDIYLDGKLVKTLLLAGVPAIPISSPVHLTPDGGFSGQTANFVYMSRAVNPQEAYDIYREGSGVDSFWSRLFNKYRIKIAFMEDNKELNSLQI